MQAQPRHGHAPQADATSCPVSSSRSCRRRPTVSPDELRAATTDQPTRRDLPRAARRLPRRRVRPRRRGHRRRHDRLRPRDRAPELVPYSSSTASRSRPVTGTTRSRASCASARATASSSPARSRRWRARSASPPGWPSGTRRAGCAPTAGTACSAATRTPGRRCGSTASAGCLRADARRGVPGAESYTGVAAEQDSRRPSGRHRCRGEPSRCRRRRPRCSPRRRRSARGTDPGDPDARAPTAAVPATNAAGARGRSSGSSAPVACCW